MERWQLAAAASESTPDQGVPQTRQVARLGSQVLDVRLGCDVCLVFPPFHNVMPIDLCGSQTLPTLTKCVEKTVYIYNTKHVHSENITHDVLNDVHLIF